MTSTTEAQAQPVLRSSSVAPLLQGTLFLGMTAIILLAFFVLPSAQGLGALTPILYFHVPMAWNGIVGLMVAAAYSGMYLKRRDLDWDVKAESASELGLLFSVIALATGSLWARGAWNAWWNWDPKQTLYLVMILIQGAYFALRSSVEEPRKRAALSGTYALFAVLTIPLLSMALPFYLGHNDMSAHPTSAMDRKMDGRMGALLLASTMAFSGIYFWVFRLRLAVGRRDLRKCGY